MPKEGPNFTPAEIDRGLTALALSGGNSTRAAQLLEQDTDLQRTPSTRILRDWKTLYAAKYDEIREQRAADIEKSAVSRYREIVLRTADTHLQAVERTAEGIEDLDANQASQAAKNLAIAGGVAADKLLLFTSRPTQIHQDTTVDQLVGKLARELNFSVTSTAEDITDAESVALPPAIAEPNVREGAG